MSELAIDDLISHTPIWVATYVPENHYRNDLPQTRLPEGIDTRLAAPYIVGELPEIVERGGPLMGDRWKTLLEVTIMDPDFNGVFNRAEAACDSLVVSHGMLPAVGRYFISWYLQLQRLDLTSASKWRAFIKALLPTEEDYVRVMEFMRKSPRNVHAVFARVAPGIDASERLDPKTKRAVLLAMPYSGNASK